MARMSLSRQDYIKKGQERDLQLVGEAPYTVYEKTTWKCIHCGKIHEKTYRALMMREFGCRCQNDYRLSDNDYVDLADTLGIRWLGNLPLNTKEMTQWRGPSGETVNASYKDMARISKSLRTRLGI